MTPYVHQIIKLIILSLSLSLSRPIEKEEDDGEEEYLIRISIQKKT